MTLSIAPPQPASLPPALPSPLRPAALVLRGISWATYEALLHDVDAAGQHVQITYDRGRMSIMSPLPVHERWKKLIGRMIELMCLELDIPVGITGLHHVASGGGGAGVGGGRVLLRPGRAARPRPHGPGPDPRPAAGPGGGGGGDPPPQPDQPPGGVRGPGGAGTVAVRRRPPDRAVAWSRRRHRPSPVSLAFPFLRPSDLERFLAMLPTTGETALMRAFRDWVRSDLAPAAGR